MDETDDHLMTDLDSCPLKSCSEACIASDPGNRAIQNFQVAVRFGEFIQCTWNIES